MKFKTQTGYTLLVRKAPPYIFQDLREAFNVDRPPFKRKYVIPDSEDGTSLDFDYEPPTEMPDPETEKDEWVLYQQFIVWANAFEEDMKKYKLARNNLMLTSCVRIVDGPRGWRDKYKKGTWAKELEHAGIRVHDGNRKSLFLKLQVLSDEDDYLRVLDAATVEEVTLEDVLRAFDYFRTKLERCPTIKNIPKFASWRDEFFSQLYGESNWRNKIGESA